MAKSQTLKTKIYYIPCYMKFLFLKFDTSPFDSIWLEISLNWHSKSQGPNKKCTHFTIQRIYSWLADTARNQGSFTTFALWSVKSFNSPTVSGCIDYGGSKKFVWTFFFTTIVLARFGSSLFFEIFYLAKLCLILDFILVIF